MKRVMIVGGPGAGKSTLARALGARTGLPVHHMDHIHWLPGWQQRPRDLRKAMAIAVENGPEWIFEGGFSTTYAHRLARADTVVWLDLPVGLRLWRVTKRSVRFRGQRRPDMAPGCVEGFSGEILEFYRYIWRTRASARAQLRALVQDAPGRVTIHHLRSRVAVARFLADLEC